MRDKLSTIKYAEYIRDLTALGNPFLLLFIAVFSLIQFDTFGSIMPVLILGFLANEIFCSGIKFFWHKPRPNGQKFDNAFEKIDAGSFPSIHAARISFVYANIAYPYYLMDKFLPVLLCILIIALVGYSRIFLKKHFLTDVIAGYIIGSTSFLLFLNWM